MADLPQDPRKIAARISTVLLSTPDPLLPPSPAAQRIAVDKPALSEAQRREIGAVLQTHTLLFVGLRPGEREFDALITLLQSCRPGEIPRAYVAIPGGPIPDYLWQKWVWRGILLFHADPIEILAALEEHLP